MKRQRLTVPTCRAKGFTLIELLMVVLITSILVAMLMPVIVQVLKSMTATKSQQRVTILSNGAIAYYKDNMVYPGQDVWGKGQLDNGTLTGSQLLAKALFADPDGSGFPRSNYAQYDPSDSLWTLNSKANTIGDCWAKGQTMALCYYPARLGETGVGMFHEADNTAYTAAAAGGTFASAIGHPAMPGVPVKANQFIIIGPGLGRTYFTADDVSNFVGQ